MEDSVLSSAPLGALGVPAVITAAAIFVVAMLARVNTDDGRQWTPAAFVAAIPTAPALASFYSVRHLTNGLSQMAGGTGGIGWLSAILSESYYLSFVAVAAAAALLAIAAIHAATIPKVEPRGSLAAFGMVIGAVLMTFVPMVYFTRATELIFAVARTDVKTPGVPATMGAVSQQLADDLVHTAVFSVIASVLLAGVVAAAFALRTRLRPSRTLAITMTLLALSVVVAAAAMYRALALGYARVAITGSPKAFGK